MSESFPAVISDARCRPSFPVAAHDTIPSLRAYAYQSSKIDEKEWTLPVLNPRDQPFDAKQLYVCESCAFQYSYDDMMIFPFPPHGNFHIICKRHCLLKCVREECRQPTIIRQRHVTTGLCLWCQFDKDKIPLRKRPDMRESKKDRTVIVSMVMAKPDPTPAKSLPASHKLAPTPQIKKKKLRRKYKSKK